MIERAAPERARAILATAARTTRATLLQSLDALAMANNPALATLQGLEITGMPAVATHGRKIEFCKGMEVGACAGCWRRGDSPGNVR